MRAMEYHIISGKVIETRRCYLPARDGSIKVRGQRRAGASSENKIRQNERSAVNHLARTLNTNFGDGLMLVTFKYDNNRIPQSYEELKTGGSKLLRQLRNTARKHGIEFKYIMVNANHNPKKDCPARFHHHCVMPVEMFHYLDEVWPQKEIHVKRVSNPGDLTALAKYLIGNVSGLQAGEKKYSCKKGMEKPIYTEPKPVDDLDGIQPVPNTVVMEAAQYCDDEGSVMSSYIRAVSKEPIKVRGGMIILPKRKKGQLPTAIEWGVTGEDEE